MDADEAKVVIAGLRSVTDAMILDRTWKDLAREIDKACAFIEMNDAPQARKSLDMAIAGWPQLADGSPRFPQHKRLIEDARRQIPAEGRRVNPRVTEKLMREEDGFVFEQTIGHPECTVIIPVPECTSPSDIVVHFSEDSLKVVIDGHEKQPAVIDGLLSQPIVLDGCSWSLTTDGPQRVLHVDLEKKASEYVWAGLLHDDAPMR